MSSALLRSRGFHPAGHWSLQPDKTLDYGIAPDGSGLYAFVIDDVVHYIGTTRRGFRERFSNFRYGHSAQKTQQRINKLLKKVLAEGATASIWVYERQNTNDCIPEQQKLQLLKEFSPSWSRRT